MARHREWRPEWSLHSVMAVPTRRPPASRTAAAPKESEVERLTVPLHTDMGPGRQVGRGGAGMSRQVATCPRLGTSRTRDMLPCASAFL